MLYPEGWPQITGYESMGLRLAKTHRIERPGVVIPAIRVWFVIRRDEGRVYLRWFEPIPY